MLQTAFVSPKFGFSEPSTVPKDSFNNENGWETVSGDWNIEGGEYHAISGDCIGILNKYDARDGVVEAKVKFPNVFIHGGIVFRYGNKDDYYVAFFTGKTFELRARKGGIYTVIGSKDFAASAGIWYKLKIVMDGRNINLYVDDNLKIKMEDESFFEGKVGFATWLSSADFRDIKVQEESRSGSSGLNIALGKIATTKSTETTNYPSVAVDGDESNSRYWASVNGEQYPQWHKVDLGRIYKINKIQLITYWGDGRYYQYKIEVSKDDEKWIQVVDETANTVPANPEGKTHIFKPTEVRYVKTTITYNSTNPCAHIVEIMVYEAMEGKPAVPAKSRILFVATNFWPHIIDWTYQEKLTNLGYAVKPVDYHALSKEMLAKYDVVVLLCPVDVSGENVFTPERVSLLLDFLRKGGGILLMPNFHGNWVKEYPKVMANILEPLGAKILVEDVRGNDKQYFEEIERFGRWQYCSTDNIAPSPITKDISLLWYPIGLYRYDNFVTHTFQVDNHWQIAVRARKSVATPSYASEPPIVAIRNYEKGRVVLFPTSFLFWIGDAYHPSLKGFVLEKGDGFKFLVNIYDWLAGSSVTPAK